MANVRKKVQRHLRTGKPFFSPREDAHPRVAKRLAKHGWDYDYDVGKGERGGWVPHAPKPKGTKFSFPQPGSNDPGATLSRQGTTRKRAIKRNLRNA